MTRHTSSKPRLSNPGQRTVQYVNFLVVKGYSVQILGGKHYSTPDGEFVELRSGTQYEILLKNSHPYGKVGLLWFHMHCSNAKVRDGEIKRVTITVMILVAIDTVLVAMIDVMKKIVDPQVLSRRSEAENETQNFGNSLKRFTCNSDEGLNAQTFSFV